MPTIARIRDGETVRKHENKYGPGITPHYLETDQVGSVEFDSTLFTEKQTEEWLIAHDYKQFTLSEGKEQADEERKHRFLSVELAPSSDIQDVDGGLLVPGVRLLAPGTWTDSTQKTPCRYTPATLERYLGNWADKSYWSRHSGGTPRDITDRIADIRNLRYNDGVTADLFFDGATTKSKDAISIIKAAAVGRVPWPYSSVEMMTRDKWIVSEKLFEAQEILFGGAAMVNQGACRTCKIRNNGAAWVEVTNDEPKIKPEKELEKEQEMVDTKELEAQIEALKKELAAKSEPIKAEIPKELSDAITTLTAQNKELAAEVKKLKEAPAPTATAAASTEKELGTVDFVATYDKETGTIRSIS